MTDTSHIQACMNRWFSHYDKCRYCDELGNIRSKLCEQGRIFYDEYCQAIKANRNCEHLTATEADTCETSKS